MISPRLMLAGGGLYMTLNNWGLIPEADVLPLDQFNATCAPEEPQRCAGDCIRSWAECFWAEPTS